eukprot:GEZU01010189.1.p1 GENE.GEZU01010189.1~~GEZU01010189.1.p1  ORF type:complete len:657 (+),score=315.31 GEZU01010189.1:74-1972(+)
MSEEVETFRFQAEINQLMSLIINTFYSNKEIFLRELISNASDALDKIRYMSLTDNSVLESQRELFIHLIPDKVNKTLTIRDSGIGMTKADLVNNLGTIARSGTKAFMEALQAGADVSMIGQFGVGFYSSFMVSKNVRVYSRSMSADSKGYCWESNGDGTFSIYEAEGVQRGTKIVMTLKDTEKEFAIKQVVERIIKKYSNFVGFDIKLNGAKVNTVSAIWMKDKNEVTPEQHKAFFEYLTSHNDDPFYTFHFTTDVPLAIHSIFYVPKTHTEKYGMGRLDPGVNLYSRKVLIQSKAKILPEWLRFIKGVVDSEDISLNISREHLQDSAVVRKLNGVLTRRFLKFLEDQLKTDPMKYKEFYDEYSNFLKEGICTDMLYQEDLAKLLIFETSKTAPGEKISLEQYINRMKPEQKHIYYLTTPNRQFAESSPYFEAFKQSDTEVLFMYGAGDDFVMTTLQNYKKKKILSIESPEAEAKAENKADADVLTTEQSTELADWLVNHALKDHITSARPSERLVSSPAIISDHENATLRRVMRMVDSSRAPSLGKQKLEFNPSHVIIRKLYAAKTTNPELARVVAEQVYDNALVAAGLLDDSRSMLTRLNNLLDLAMKDISLTSSSSSSNNAANTTTNNA